MAEEKLWKPIWREDWRDDHYLLPRERAVWEQAIQKWEINLGGGWQVENPFGYVTGGGDPFILFPESVIWNGGIGPPDELRRNVRGKEFVQGLTQIRMPVLFRSRFRDFGEYQQALSSMTDGTEIPAVMNEAFEGLFRNRLALIYPAPYCGADCASKFMTIFNFLQEWSSEIGYQINKFKSKIICFQADRAVKEQIRVDVPAEMGERGSWMFPMVREIEAPDSWEQE